MAVGLRTGVVVLSDLLDFENETSYDTQVQVGMCTLYLSRDGPMINWCVPPVSKWVCSVFGTQNQACTLHPQWMTQ